MDTPLSRNSRRLGTARAAAFVFVEVFERMRAPPVPIPRMDPRSRPIEPFLGLSTDDLIAAMVLLMPAGVFYTYRDMLGAAVAAAAGVVAAVPLVLFPPVDGRRGYARLLAWALWLFDPRIFYVHLRGPGSEPQLYVREVLADGRRGRRRLLSDPSAGAR